MDVSCLRDLLRAPIVGLFNHGHKALPDICARLGLPPPGEGSRRERMRASFDRLADADVPKVADRYLAEFSPPASLRNAIQDLLWADATTPSIPKRFRRELAKALTADDLYLDASRFDALLASLYIVDDDPLGALLGGSEQLAAR